MKQRLKIFIIALLLLGVAISLSSCRESLVIARIIHDQQQQEQDLDTEMRLAENDEDNTQKDEDLPQKETTEATKTQQQQKVAKNSGQAQQPGTAPRTVHDDDSSNNNKADKSGNNNGKNSRKSKNKNGDNGNENGNEGGQNGGQGGERQVYDDNGDVVDLPKDVNSVVAAGSAGIITQMLGGKSVLKGSSVSVTGSPLAQNVFADEDFAGAQAYWDGNGSSPMSSSAFKVLLKNKPDVCVGNGSSFSDKQIAKLKKKGIAYVAIPALDTTEHIENLHAYLFVCQLEIIPSRLGSPFIYLHKFLSRIIVDMNEM